MLFLTQSQHMRWENYCRGDRCHGWHTFMVNAGFEPLFKGCKSLLDLIVSDGSDDLRKNGGEMCVGRFVAKKPSLGG